MTKTYIKQSKYATYHYKDEACTIYHREDGSAVEYANGTKAWYLNGKPHREDGPAIEHIKGNKEWWVNGKRHREDGPAVEFACGEKCWWLNDEEYSEEEHKRLVKMINFL